jgi:hypothetical protein
MKDALPSVDQIWQRLRRPFRYPRAGHTCSWERYDADRAGCMLCGALHKCNGSMIDCECPLVETDEGGHVCLITGLCISEVRAATCEFVDHACFDHARECKPLEDEGLHDKVTSIIRHFLTSNKTITCRRLEYEKYMQRTKQTFWKVLKQRKRDHSYTLPCLCSVVAEVAHLEQLQQFQGSRTVMFNSSEYDELVDRVVNISASNITTCIVQIHGMGFRKLCQGGKFQSMIVGMLYMSRTGLHISNLFRLPAVRGVQDLLPSETYLNSLGISNKVICDTENEIKSCIRVYTENKTLLLRNPGRNAVSCNKTATSAILHPNISVKQSQTMGLGQSTIHMKKHSTPSGFN